ncbi:hypothetical protein [Neobacillus kokaensis]|nr:hypothetical protein [Neobacillus kokaensis]
MYKRAYQYYRAACQRYDMDSLNFYQFLKDLTKEQLDEYLKQAIF